MTSENYRMWTTIDDPKRCPDCKRLHGKVYHRRETIRPRQPLHMFCRCRVKWLSALPAGTATKWGKAGADWYLRNYGCLPSYYVSAKEAKSKGWNPKKGNFDKLFSRSMLEGGIYNNRNAHLPTAPGRIWYEADIDYYGGYRGQERILYSNDGLIFVTYDHYTTFAEII